MKLHIGDNLTSGVLENPDRIFDVLVVPATILAIVMNRRYLRLV
jgi:hypothetical protein